jgi:hypothetical protein
MGELSPKNYAGRPKGRPSTEPDEGERVPFGFRITPSMKRAMQEAAGYNGRSLSQEAEMRLERSFQDDGIIARLDRIEAMLTAHFRRGDE